MSTDKNIDYINRELSWLEFNERVLQCAENKAIPLLERVKFCAITSSNLDEFFMVRVGGLQLLVKENIRKKDQAGLMPQEQLDAIYSRYQTMVDDQYTCYKELEVEMREKGINRLLSHELTDEQSRHAEFVFDQELFPVLSPMALDPDSPPLLVNRMLYVAVRLRLILKVQGNTEGETKFKGYRIAIIPIGKTIGRFITMPGGSGYQYLLVEDLVSVYVNRFFPGEEIIECTSFRITRNADFSVHEDGAHDLLFEMEAVIDARKRGECVRLECAENTTDILINQLGEILTAPKRARLRCRGPLDLSACMQISNIAGFDALKYKPWPPRHLPILASGASMFERIAKSDILLYHPYDSFDPVVRFVEEASRDPQVVAIKQILYRTSKKSPIVAALALAAENGKYVTAIVELKARFDEERNIEWASELEDAGVQIVYGVKGLKTHAKVCIVIRREKAGLVRYAHFGTGNYNEITAGIYSDVSYLTCNEDLCADASAFFNAISGNSQPQKYRKIEAAPLTMKEKILELIGAETERSRQGQKAFIYGKMNSLTHPDIIEALYEASRAGVSIKLNIRGICCLKPGIKGLSDTITVKSIVGRFLEHARIICFGNGGKEKIFICTADWMQRNLDKRVELMVPVEDIDSKNRIRRILDLCESDTENSWLLARDGMWQKTEVQKNKTNCHSILYTESCEKSDRAKRLKRTAFETHKPVKRKK